MNKKTIVTKKNIDKLANFIKTACDDYKENDASGCYNFKLSEDLVLAVGWSDGYDMADTDIIKSKQGQKQNGSWVCGYAVNAGIKVRNDFDCSDYDMLNFPWYPEGDCADVSTSIAPDWEMRDYKKLAKSYLGFFVTLQNMINKGKLLTH